MPSPFRRKSVQIQPMSQAELDASLAELEAAEEADKAEGLYIRQYDPNDENSWQLSPTLGTAKVHHLEGDSRLNFSREAAHRQARFIAEEWGVPFLGER